MIDRELDGFFLKVIGPPFSNCSGDHVRCDFSSTSLLLLNTMMACSDWLEDAKTLVSQDIPVVVLMSYAFNSRSSTFSAWLSELQVV